jgi:16S rRNA (cytosine967-C5)-methyltransferase
LSTNARLQAVLALKEIIGDRKSLNYALPHHTRDLAPQERGMAKQIVFGVMRWSPRLQFQLKQLMKKPFKGKDSDLQCILLAGIYQMSNMNVNDYAAINESVELTRKLNKGWASKVINGVLRNFQRQQEELQTKTNDDLAARWAHPQWFIKEVKAAWPTHWKEILEANNQQAPMAIRVNQRHQSRAEYCARLDEIELGYQLNPFNDTGLRMAQAVDVFKLPGFEEGDVSVQDSAPQLAADLLDLQPGQRVLDACAAPGGKTAHILENQAELKEVVAIDKKKNRVAMIADTLGRLQLSATLVVGDAAKTDKWWDGEQFDRILLDVPCSATGVIRRNPDIKFFRQAEDVASVVLEQQRLLDDIWPLLAPGGQLVYATCSILPQENSQQITQFLAKQDDAEEIPIDANWGLPCEHGRQVLPGMDDMDGFFYACLRKQ